MTRYNLIANTRIGNSCTRELAELRKARDWPANEFALYALARASCVYVCAYVFACICILEWVGSSGDGVFARVAYGCRSRERACSFSALRVYGSDFGYFFFCFCFFFLISREVLYTKIWAGSLAGLKLAKFEDVKFRSFPFQ